MKNQKSKFTQVTTNDNENIGITILPTSPVDVENRNLDKNNYPEGHCQNINKSSEILLRNPYGGLDSIRDIQRYSPERNSERFLTQTNEDIELCNCITPIYQKTRVADQWGKNHSQTIGLNRSFSSLPKMETSNFTIDRKTGKYITRSKDSHRILRVQSPEIINIHRGPFYQGYETDCGTDVGKYKCKDHEFRRGHSVRSIGTRTSGIVSNNHQNRRAAGDGMDAEINETEIVFDMSSSTGAPSGHLGFVGECQCPCDHIVYSQAGYAGCLQEERPFGPAPDVTRRMGSTTALGKPVPPGSPPYYRSTSAASSSSNSGSSRSNTSRSAKISFIIAWGMAAFSFSMCNLGSLGHLFISLKAGSRGAEMSEDMTIAIGGLGLLVVLVLFKIKNKKWIQYLLKLTNFNEFGVPDDLMEVTARCNLFSKCYTFYVFGGMCYYIFLTVYEMDCTNQGEVNKFCGTLSQTWLPVKKVSIVTIEIIFVSQAIICLWVCTGAGNVFFLSFETADLVVCHINHLKKNISNVFKHDDEKRRKIELANCVKYHNHIYDLGRDLNGLIKFTFGHISLTAAIIMGMLAVQIEQRYKPLGAITYLGGYTAALFLLALAGQKVTDESVSLSEVVFESDWRKGSNEMKKDFAFIIRRAQDPITIDALPLGTFNYSLFITMLKAAYSYFTLLQQSVF